MNDDTPRAEASDARRFLAIYLRDHFAGSVVGLALVQRCRRSNAGTPLATVLGKLEGEITDEQQSLRAMMDRLAIAPSRVKALAGSATDLVGRLKGNGRIVRYSPLSRQVELEGLAAMIVTKRNLWRALLAVDDPEGLLDRAELGRLVEQATSQFERVLAEHRMAAAAALSAALSGAA